MPQEEGLGYLCMTSGFVWGVTSFFLNNDIPENRLTMLYHMTYTGTLCSIGALFISTLVPYPFAYAVPVACYASCLVKICM